MQKVYSTAYQIDRAGQVNAAREASGSKLKEPSHHFDNSVINVHTKFDTMGN